RALLAAAGLAAWLGAGLGSATAADQVTVGALRFTSHAPSFIAYERGYFRDEGLEVELKFFQAAQPIAVAIASGDIDFGVTALTGGFYSLADKGAVKVVGGLYAEKPGVPGMAILASNQAWEAGLKSPADLKGRSWAMTQQGSSFHYVAGMIAERNGFALSDMSLKALQKVPSMIGAVKSGQVDAMAMVPHVAVPLENSGAARIIGWVRDLGPYLVTSIFTSTRNVEERREMVERFLRAYARGIEDYRAAFLDPEADQATVDGVIDVIHKHVYTDQPREKAAPSILAGAVHMNEGAALDVANIAEQLAWYQAQGLAPEGLAVEDFVDTGFVATTE
ncbi:MAG: ABC transporter substrate-binding protein, partial [Tistlia sp.]